MTTRRGLGKGKGSGWKNIISNDPHRHGLAAKGVKTAALSPRLRKRVRDNPKLATMNFANLQKNGVFLKYQGDADKDGVVNVKDCQPLNMNKQDRIFEVKKGITISARSEPTRYGFRHIVVLFKDGQEIGRAKETYQNRTWERYEFETAIRTLLDSTDILTESEKKKFLERGEKLEKERVEKEFGMVAGIAKMGEVLNDTTEDKNKWKKRMLKAGLPALDFPEDWDRLSESEKEKRLNKVIAMLKER